jgi:hypothetical protein
MATMAITVGALPLFCNCVGCTVSGSAGDTCGCITCGGSLDTLVFVDLPQPIQNFVPSSIFPPQFEQKAIFFLLLVLVFLQ